MSLIIMWTLFSFNNQLLLAQRGKNIDGPSTYGQQTYPNSGSTKNRRNIMGGKASSAAQASDASGHFEHTDQRQEKQEQEDNNSFKMGPYNREGEYQYLNRDEGK